MKVRKRLSPDEAKLLGLPVKDKDGTRNARYYITEEEWDFIRGLRPKESVPEQKEQPVIDGFVPPRGFSVVKVSQNLGNKQKWVTIVKNTETPAITEEDIDRVVSRYVNEKVVPPEVNQGLPNSVIDRLVLSDFHIGLNTDVENKYGGNKWTEDDIMNTVVSILWHVKANKKSDTLLIDDLGDFVDGYDGFTSRHQHGLDQTMSTTEIYDLAIKVKMYLIDRLVEIYDHIVLHNVCNDNHAGSFAYIINSTIKSICKFKYNTRVDVINYNGFLTHYTVGKTAFILTHGKDKKHAKNGLSPFIKPDIVRRIYSYMAEHGLIGYKVEVSKGDSHRAIFDLGASAGFDYCNYPAICPPSEWTVVNYGGEVRRGVVFQNIDQFTGNKTISILNL